MVATQAAAGSNTVSTVFSPAAILKEAVAWDIPYFYKGDGSTKYRYRLYTHPDHPPRRRYYQVTSGYFSPLHSLVANTMRLLATAATSLAVWAVAAAGPVSTANEVAIAATTVAAGANM